MLCCSSNCDEKLNISHTLLNIATLMEKTGPDGQRIVSPTSMVQPLDICLYKTFKNRLRSKWMTTKDKAITKTKIRKR